MRLKDNLEGFARAVRIEVSSLRAAIPEDVSSLTAAIDDLEDTVGELYDEINEITDLVVLLENQLL
jgi:hypothetical protein